MQSDTLSAPEVVAFYRQIIDEGDRSMLPMLSLVQRIASKEYAHRFAASNSHEALCIKGVFDYMITVGYMPDAQEFVIRFWEKNSRHCQKYCVAAPDAEGLIDSLALRLHLQGTHAN